MIRPRSLPAFRPDSGRVLTLVAAAALCLIAASWTTRARGQTQDAGPVVSGVLSVGITVSDLDRLTEFYVRTLAFERESEAESTGDGVEHLSGTFGVRRKSAVLRLGRERIELTQYLAPEGRPIPADSRSNDRWFQHIAIVVSDMDRAYEHLRRSGVRHASPGPQTLPARNATAGGISAFYFKDPDGHVLEVIHFPPDKGDPRWQQPGDGLFLGIDHTAIVVADTARSTEFYGGLLGLRIAGTGENDGPEQERLNNVFGARLRITALRAEAGPGIELLEYLAPTDGRDYPTDARAPDLLSWTTNLAAARPDHLAEALARARARWISPGMVPGLDPGTGWARALSVRDPDGHALVIGEPAPRPLPARQDPARPPESAARARHRRPKPPAPRARLENRRMRVISKLGIIGTVSMGTLILSEAAFGLQPEQRFHALRSASGGTEFNPADAAAGAVAIHFLAAGEAPGSVEFVREYLRRASALAGVRHVFVKPGESEAVEAWARQLGDDAVNIYVDPGDTLAMDLRLPYAVPAAGAPPRRPATVVLAPGGRELLRSIGSSEDDGLPFDDFARRLTEKTRQPAIAEYNLPADKPLAVEGYDVVAYFTRGSAVKGRAEVASTYRGIEYRFDTEDDRRLFAADPERYLPTYGGWCASAMGAKGTKVEIDPANFKVKDGRLFLFYKSLFGDALKDWNRHERDWEPAADRNWKQLTGEEPARPAR